MDSQTLNNIDESIPTDYAAVEEPNHGRFPRHQVDVTETDYREVNVDQLSESDFEGMKDSGLAYSDHDYIGSNPNAKVAPETSQFPVMGGVTDQYLNGETNDPCAERTDNRMSGMLNSGSGVKKPQHPSALRTVKSDDYVGTSAAHHTYSHGKAVPYKDVTQPKKSGRPSKNESRELAGDRLMGRAMVKAGMQGHHVLMQPQQHIHLQGMQAIQDSVNFRGAAPIVTPARGQKITPRGRPAIGLRRDIPDDGTSAYMMMPAQQGIPSSKLISTKKMANFGSAQAAEDAHTREMMEAAQNALAPSNATICGMNTTMSVQPPLPSHSSLPNLHPHASPHHDSIVLPSHNRPRTSSHRFDEGDIPRTPGKGRQYTPISSPQSAHVRTPSESHEMNIQLLHQPLRTNSDGLPVTPGGGRRTSMTSRTPRARMSISESTGSHTSSPQRSIVLTPPRPQVLLQSRPIPPSPQPSRQMAIGGHLKPSTGPSTMASAQMQMTSNAPLPSLHTQSQPMVVQRQTGESPSKRPYYDLKSAQAAPLITATGSTSYNPRRKKEKDTGEGVDAAVSRNVQAILQSEKTERQSTTRSDISLSPRNDMSDEDIIRGGRQATAYESKRTASKKKGHKDFSSVESSSGESDSEKWEISCICGQKDDDGEEMVQCDQCILRWEHVDCIFPRTKKAPSGNYFCHVCKPRPTELTREQARAYQDRVKSEKDEAKNQETKRKLAERARRKEENSRKPSSVIRSTSKSSALKSEKTGNSSYREILKNEYSTNARRFLSISGPSISNSSGVDIIKTLRNSTIIRSLIVEPNIKGIVTLEEVREGAYIAELLGYVSLQKECLNRDLVPGSLNDQTFLFEMDHEKFIIDSRKCGNVLTKFLRRSCQPNAELEAIMCGSEIHFMIKATQRLAMHDEVSIKLEEGWMKKPRPAQGCGCDKMKENKCELERFFMPPQNIPSSSRKSLPANGSNVLSGRSPIRRAHSERKKVASVKKVITKKGKRKGTIKLPQHNRKMKGGSGRGIADEMDEEEEESDMEYEESEDDKRKERRGRGRRKTEGSSDRIVKERGKMDIKKKGWNEDESLLSLDTSIRSTSDTREIRLRDDSKMKKGTTLMINEDNNEKRKSKRISESEIGESTKGGRKNVIEKGIDEIKEEPQSINKTKKTPKKPWPVMDYTLPSERGKDSREERKLKAECERIERQSKMSGSKTRGRPPASSYGSTKEKKKGKERDEKITSSGRGKRKADSEDEDGGTECIPAMTPTPIHSSRKRLTTFEGRKREEDESSSLATSLVSLVSPMTEDTTHGRSLPTSGKKKLLLRYQEAEKEKAAALERCRVEVPSTTPTRWNRLNKEEKGDKGNRKEIIEKGKGNRHEMRKHAIYLRDTLSPSIFSIGDMSEEGRGRGREIPCIGTPSTHSTHSTLVTPSHPSSSIMSPSSTPVPCVSIPIENEKTVKKSGGAVSYEEYKKRKRGEITSGEEKTDKHDKKEEVAKKSFMPRVDSSVYVPPSLPNVTLPGLDEHVGLDELKRRVYDDTPRRGGPSSSISAIGKSDPTPKRQSINDRLKNEFSLPMLSTPPPSSSTTLISASTTLSTISMPSLANEDLLTPTGGRVHKNRLSDAKAPNVRPPGLMTECPRPISLDSPSITSSTSVMQSTASSTFFYS